MHIILRTSPYRSPHKAPFGFDTKPKIDMCQSCWGSFLPQIDLDEDYVTIINDGWLNKEFNDIYFGVDYEVIEGDCGNVQTFHQQLRLEKKQEMVLLLEDDYLWRPNTLKPLKDSLSRFDFVSPYDHPGHYLEERFNYPKEIILFNGYTYHKIPSNTLTFACKADVLEKNYALMRSFDLRDHEMWTEIGGLYAPNSSFATHMVEALLAPNVEWQNYL